MARYRFETVNNDKRDGMRYKATILIGMLLLSVAVRSQEQRLMSLDSCLAYARRHNLQMLDAGLGLEQGRVQRQGAAMRFLPSASASGSHTLVPRDERNTQYSIGAHLTLFDGLQTLRSYRQSRLAERQSTLAVEQTRMATEVGVVQAYLTVLMNRERLSYQRERLGNSQRQRDDAEAKYKAGRLLESDYLLLAANCTQAESEIENSQLAIARDLNDLAVLIGLADSIALEIDTLAAPDTLLPALDTLLARAMRTMPDWEMSQLEVEQARLGVKLAEGSFMPTLTASATYGNGWVAMPMDEGMQSLDGGGTVSLGVSIPLFDQGAHITQLRQSRLSLQQAQLQHRQRTIDLKEKIEELYVEARQARNRMQASEALATAYRATYDVYTLKYDEGTVSTVEMLQQQDRWLSALNDWLQNKYSFMLQQKQIKIYTE